MPTDSSSGNKGRRGKKAKNLNMDVTLEARLTSILRREGTTFTHWVHRMAEAYIQAHEAGNPQTPLTNWLKDPDFVACPTLLDCKNHNWEQYKATDLRTFEAIMIRERQRIYNARRKKEWEARE